MVWNDTDTSTGQVDLTPPPTATAAAIPLARTGIVLAFTMVLCALILAVGNGMDWYAPAAALLIAGRLSYDHLGPRG